MLTEFAPTNEPEEGLTKRIFNDAYFDLYVWVDRNREVASFQLCYNKIRDEHALTWKRPSHFYHQRVDDGEGRPGKNKSTPILLADGAFDARGVIARFIDESMEIDPDIASFVRSKLVEFKSSHVDSHDEEIY